MKKEIKILDIELLGYASIIGTIAKTLGHNLGSNYNNYCWLIICDESSIDEATLQCNDLEIDEYMIVPRQHLISSNILISSKKIQGKYDVWDWVVTHDGDIIQIDSDDMNNLAYEQISRHAFIHEIPNQN